MNIFKTGMCSRSKVGVLSSPSINASVCHHFRASKTAHEKIVSEPPKQHKNDGMPREPMRHCVIREASRKTTHSKRLTANTLRWFPFQFLMPQVVAAFLGLSCDTENSGDWTSLKIIANLAFFLAPCFFVANQKTDRQHDVRKNIDFFFLTTNNRTLSTPGHCQSSNSFSAWPHTLFSLQMWQQQQWWIGTQHWLLPVCLGLHWRKWTVWFQVQHACQKGACHGFIPFSKRTCVECVALVMVCPCHAHASLWTTSQNKGDHPWEQPFKKWQITSVFCWTWILMTQVVWQQLLEPAATLLVVRLTFCFHAQGHHPFDNRFTNNCNLFCKRTVKKSVHKKDHNCEPFGENWTTKQKVHKKSVHKSPSH